ncbi:NAD-dependent epimerase/dehydratase family protein [Marinicellulosiphila megalodicopiae]|uniref:NAD-dependent epimerase/dehydratase family protein n=1 Tax=Marinicellulosiphila megalodicopiae TaxID=2724896 RepID=UPI003BB111C5
MKTAFVLGFSGSFGFAMTQALLAKGYKVTALIRNSKQRDLYQHTHLSFVEGDLLDKTCLKSNCQAHDIIVYGVNVPYADWQTKAIQYLSATLKACEGSKARFVFPANIYPYNPIQHSQINEQTPQQSLHFLADVRIEMESQIKQASKNGLNVLIMRAGNYIGAQAPSSWLRFLVKQSKQQITISATGNPDSPTSYAFLPDLAKDTADVLETNLNDFEEFCFAGHHLSFNDMKQNIEQHTPLSVKMAKFPWGIIKIMSLFIRKMKYLDVTRYLFNTDMRINDNKLSKQLGRPCTKTVFTQVLVESQLISYEK